MYNSNLNYSFSCLLWYVQILAKAPNMPRWLSPYSSKLALYDIGPTSIPTKPNPLTYSINFPSGSNPAAKVYFRNTGSMARILSLRRILKNGRVYWGRCGWMHKYVGLQLLEEGGDDRMVDTYLLDCQVVVATSQCGYSPKLRYITQHN